LSCKRRLFQGKTNLLLKINLCLRMATNGHPEKFLNLLRVMACFLR